MKYSRKQQLAGLTKATGEDPDQLSPISGPILDWLPGESLYSLIARNHYYRGHQDPLHIVYAFFGTSVGKSRQMDMTEIDVLVARTEGSLGTAQQVLEERTLLRFYRIFMEGDRFFEPGRLSTDSTLKFPMGLQTGRFRIQHPLKGCSVCLEQDARDIGFQYWRLSHQFLGLWVCLTETMKTICVGRFLIDVPAEAKVSFQGAFLQGWDVSTYADETDEQFVMRLVSKEAELKSRKNEKGGTSLESTVQINGDGVHGKLFIFDRNWVYGIVDGERKDDTFAATLAYVRRQDISVNFSS